MNELAWLAGSRIVGEDTRLSRKLAKGPNRTAETRRRGRRGSGSSQAEAVRAEQMRERLNEVEKTARGGSLLKYSRGDVGLKRQAHHARARSPIEPR